MSLVMMIVTLIAAVVVPFLLSNNLAHRIALLLISSGSILFNYFSGTFSAWIYLTFIVFTVILKANYRSTLVRCDDAILGCNIIFYIQPLVFRII